MEEKKLTDEEVIEALGCCVKGETCTTCPYFIKRIDCVYHRRAEGDALDLIHRLQAENELLKERNYWLESEHEYQCEKSYFEGVEKGQKDTEKEILQGFNKWLNQAISISYEKSVKGSVRYGGMNNAFHEVKELVKKVAEEKGVEVE